MADSKLTYRLLERSDVDEVKRFLETNMAERYAPNVYLGVTAEEMVASGYYDLSEIYVEQGNSFGAFDGTNLCGVLMNVDHRDKRVYDALEKEMPIPKLAKIRRVRKALLNGRPLAEILGTDNYWEQKLACVAPKYEGRSIIGQLDRLSRAHALENGVDMLVAYTTYRLHRRAYKEVRKERALSMPDFVDPVTGKKEFAGLKPPYDEFALLVADLKGKREKSRL